MRRVGVPRRLDVALHEVEPRVERRVGDGFDDPAGLEGELGAKPRAAAHAGAVAEPVEHVGQLVPVALREHGHAGARRAGAGRRPRDVRLGLLRPRLVRVVDEVLVGHALDVDDLAGARDDQLRELAQDARLAGRDGVRLDLVLDGLHALARVRAARGVEDTLVELLHVEFLGGRVEPLLVRLGLDAVPRAGFLGGEALHAFPVNNPRGLPQGSQQARVAVGGEIEGRVARNRHDHAGGDLRIHERAGHDRDGLVRERGPGQQADDLLARDVDVERLGAFELPFQFALPCGRDAPDFAWGRVADLAVLPDAHEVVLDVGADPDVGGAEDGLGAQRGARQDDGLVVQGLGGQTELQRRELEDLRVAALLEVGLGLVDGHGAGHGAEGRVVWLLDEQALGLEGAELPADELHVGRVDGGAVAALVDEEAEGLPVVVGVDVREVVDDAARVGEGLDGAVALGVVAVGQQVVGLLAALDLGGEGDGGDAGGVEPGGEQDLVARHALVAREDVGVGEAPHVADVQVPGDAGVGEVDEERGFPSVSEGTLVPAGDSRGSERTLVPGGECRDSERTLVPARGRRANGAGLGLPRALAGHVHRGRVPPGHLRVRRPLGVVHFGVPPAPLPLRRDARQVPFRHGRRSTGGRPKKVGASFPAKKRKGGRGRREQSLGWPRRRTGWRRCRRARSCSAWRCCRPGHP